MSAYARDRSRSRFRGGRGGGRRASDDRKPGDSRRRDDAHESRPGADPWAAAGSAGGGKKKKKKKTQSNPAMDDLSSYDRQYLQNIQRKVDRDLDDPFGAGCYAN